MLNFFAIFLSTAVAEETTTESNWLTKGFETQEIRFLVGATNESLSDSSIVQTYDSSNFFPTISLQYRFHTNLAAAAEVGFADMTGNLGKSSFQTIPSSFSIQALFGNDRVEPFAALGLSIVHFLESYPEGTISGTKVGLDYRAGCRIKTNLIQPSQHPSLQQGPKQMDFEFHLGQRIHQITGGDGFNMSAIRIGIGLNTRF